MFCCFVLWKLYGEFLGENWELLGKMGILLGKIGILGKIANFFGKVGNFWEILWEIGNLGKN